MNIQISDSDAFFEKMVSEAKEDFKMGKFLTMEQVDENVNTLFNLPQSQTKVSQKSQSKN